jgi:hypothetical protein
LLQCNKTHCTGEFWEVNRFRRSLTWNVVFRKRNVALGASPWHSATHSQAIAERSRATSMNSTLDSHQQDQVVLLDGVPNPAADAPEPFVVANERRVVIAYRIAEADFERFGPFDEDDDPFCAVEFSAAAFHQFGPPNDEGLYAHPLAAQGLRGYSAHEIVNSSLVADSWGADAAQDGFRHYVLTFQDSTYECVAADCTVVGIYGNGDIAAREAFSLCK